MTRKMKKIQTICKGWKNSVTGAQTTFIYLAMPMIQPPSTYSSELNMGIILKAFLSNLTNVDTQLNFLII